MRALGCSGANGNDRLGWLMTAVFFEINEISRADIHAVHELVMKVAGAFVGRGRTEPGSARHIR